jgi:hypothetical protein
VLSNVFFRPRMQLLFVLLSGADLALTWWLLGGSGGEVYEANPVANWWLARAGWAGLAGFKAALVLLVLGLAAVIGRHRPRAADGVLCFACAAVAAVVLYSATLCPTAWGSAEQRQAQQDLLAGRACDCDAPDIPGLVGRLRTAGLGLRVVPTGRNAKPDHNAYLTATGKGFEQLHAVPRMPEFIGDWRGTVYCERLYSQRARQEARQGGDYCLLAGPFLIFGDPELLARIRACLA